MRFERNTIFKTLVWLGGLSPLLGIAFLVVIALFGELEENLNTMGFVVKQRENHLHITGIPAICDDKQVGQLFEDILYHFGIRC